MTILETKQLSKISHDIFLNIADRRERNRLPLPVESLPKTGAVPPTVPANGSNLAAGQFQELRDTANLIKSKPGMFWCYTHLQDLPLEKQSPDPRYCQDCYALLLHEVDDMKSSGNHHKPWWIPKTANEKNVQAGEQLAHNMSTVNSQNITVDKLDPPIPVRPIVHPGPKSMALPLDRIVKLAADGMGSKLIAKQLNADGIEVSYKIIQRLLKKVKA
jgi:hypothetical protein